MKPIHLENIALYGSPNLVSSVEVEQKKLPDLLHSTIHLSTSDVTTILYCTRIMERLVNKALNYPATTSRALQGGNTVNCLRYMNNFC